MCKCAGLVSALCSMWHWKLKLGVPSGTLREMQVLFSPQINASALLCPVMCFMQQCGF
uniref:Uncharacterized protein n=1 Tax=Arundo donax TaxID=35708 RepID=A0A0A9GZ93_ARUDO